MANYSAKERAQRLAATKRYRAKHKDRVVAAVAKYRAGHIKKCWVHRVTSTAVQMGLLTRAPCEVCGDPKSFAHHPDYNCVLNVLWLCGVHHDEWHRKHGPGLNGADPATIRQLKRYRPAASSGGPVAIPPELLPSRKEHSSRYIGVYFDKRKQRFRASVSLNNQTRNLGTFQSEEEAARVRDRVASKIYGPWARLNFPEEA